jgi:hypothetical protein
VASDTAPRNVIVSAAATRRALLDQAGGLLNSGHFADKESLLTAVAAEGWERLGEDMRSLRADDRARPADTLREALATVLALSRTSIG